MRPALIGICVVTLALTTFVYISLWLLATVSMDTAPGLALFLSSPICLAWCCERDSCGSPSRLSRRHLPHC